MNQRIADNCLRLVLFETVQGKALTVGRRIEAELRGRVRGDVHAYLIFGHYDVAVLFEARGFTDPVLSRMGTIPGITGSIEIPCILWRQHSTGTRIVRPKLGPALTISFLKLRPALILRRGLELEADYAGYFSEDRSILCSSLGWAECVAIGSPVSPSMNRLFDKVLGINLTHTWAKGQPYRLVPHKSLSTIGLRLDIVDQDPPPRFLAGRISPDRNGSASVRPVVDMYCKPEFLDRIRLNIRRVFSDTLAAPVEFVLGSNDIHFEVKSGTWAGFVTRVLDLKQDCAGMVFDTSVTLTRTARPLRQAPPGPQAITPPLIRVSSDQAREIVTSNSTGSVGHRVLRAVYDFNSLIQDEVTRDSFADMQPFAVRVRRLLIRRSADADSALEDMLGAFRWGIEQRSLGAFAEMEEAHRGFSPYRGGIHRLIQSIEYLPAKVLQNIGLKWDGYVTIGQEDRFHHLHGVLNLPEEYAFAPEMWWGLFHEIGHVINETKPKYLVDLSSFNRAAKRGLGWEEYDTSHFVNEIAADIFDYTCGFRCDWPLYVRTVWGYLSTYYGRTGRREDVRDHVTRTCFVALHRKLSFEPRTGKYAPTAGYLDRLFRATVRRIGVTRLQTIADLKEDDFVNHALEIAAVLSELLAYVSAESRKIESSLAHMSPLRQSNFDRARTVTRKLLEGQPVTTEIVNPEIVVYLLLKNQRHLTLRSRVATILSFWHSFVKSFPDRVSFERPGR